MKLIIKRPNFLHFTKFTYESSTKLMNDITLLANELIELKKIWSRLKYEKCELLFGKIRGSSDEVDAKTLEIGELWNKIWNFKVIKSECGKYELQPSMFVGWVDNVNKHIFIEPSICTLDEWFDKV
jgi:hypothetical protein